MDKKGRLQDIPTEIYIIEQLLLITTYQETENMAFCRPKGTGVKRERITILATQKNKNGYLKEKEKTTSQRQ